MKLAVIPARGGSKRIPRKNIKCFSGKPIIAWIIESLIASQFFDKVIVSTDDEEIANLSINYGAEVPFNRPADLANDYTATIPVIQHAISELENKNQKPDFICCVYPTAILVNMDDVKEAFFLLQPDCDYVFSATSYASPIQRAFYLNENNQVEMFQPENFFSRSQDLIPALHDAGQFYWGSYSTWMDQKKTFFSQKSKPFLIPRYRVQDIDTEEDWINAELLFKTFNSK